MERYLSSLEELVNAAVKVSMEWERIDADKSDELSNSYPLPVEFSMFISQLMQWHETLINNQRRS
jgi:hypothetical protein